MKRILVPTDFSPTAEKAFRFAVDIAIKAKAMVVLYHSFTPMESTFVGTEDSRKEYNTTSEAKIAERLHLLRKKVIGGSPDVAVSTIVGHAPLIGNTLEFAEQNQIDLIVMGTQGASGLKKVIIGSVAARIIEKSSLPVLLVPEKYELEDPGKFVFATNYQASDKKALTLVDALAKLYHAEITVLHFLSVDAVEKEKEQNDFDNYALSLQKLFSESKLKFHLLETSSLIETMETLDSKFSYDIMAMLRRKKTFLEKFFIKSFTENMAYITTKPLLIVPG